MNLHRALKSMAGYATILEHGSKDSPFSYPATPFQHGADVPRPRYSDLVTWMRHLSGRAASLDYWARGNYARRLAALQKSIRKPLLVSVTSVQEMRWAYQRLALLGQPVEFIWNGELSPPVRLLHLHPGGDDDMWDGGWGYVTTLHKVTIRRRVWAPIAGYARLLPEDAASWLVDEAPEALATGDVFITPSLLVGGNPHDPDGSAALEALSGLLSFRSNPAARFAMNLNLPALDNLRPKDFTKLISDHADELQRLRYAFGQLVAATPNADIDDLVAAVNYETAEITIAERHSRLRSAVTRIGGVVGTTSATLGALAASSVEVGTMLASAAGVAALGICECLRQMADSGLELRRQPFYLLWKLGAKRKISVRRHEPAKSPLQAREPAPIGLGEDGYFHWLAPPTAGVGFLVVRKTG